MSRLPASTQLKSTTLSFLLWVALCFFWYLMLQIVWPYTSGATDIDFLQSKQHIVHLTHYMASFYLHIFSSLWLLASGLTQFSSTLLGKYPQIHRWVGRIYVFIILICSGPAAFVMAYYANGGLIAQLSFMLLSALWWWFTYKGYMAIRNNNIKIHGEWLLRSYALTLSAITLRVMQWMFANFSEIPAEEVYVMIAFPSWLINLLIAEIIINKTNWFAWIMKKPLKTS